MGRVAPQSPPPSSRTPHPPHSSPPHPALFLIPWLTLSADAAGPLTWIDPGAFALVGAGAFMGGVTRLTVALAVIMIEVSSDVRMLLPVLVAIMTVRQMGRGEVLC